MTSIHTWTSEQRRELVQIVEVKAAELVLDSELAEMVADMLSMAGIANTQEARKTLILGAVLHSIGTEDL